VRRPRRTRPGGQEGDEAAASDAGLPANAAETPLLEPRSSPSSKDELQARHRVLEGRLGKVERSSDTLKFTAADRRTLEDARGFLRQSERALHDGDMIRAEQLAQKASLLLAALEQK
jgi:hypothetical protein